MVVTDGYTKPRYEGVFDGMSFCGSTQKPSLAMLKSGLSPIQFCEPCTWHSVRCVLGALPIEYVSGGWRVEAETNNQVALPPELTHSYLDVSRRKVVEF